MVLPDLVDDEMDFVEVGVLAAGAVGRVGKHSDAGLLTGETREGLGGVFDDSV